MSDPTRTDHMPIDEFRRRAVEAKNRGDEHMPVKVLNLKVRFHANFDTFAANVAYAIRHHIVYRSDGGVFARGFVRATGDLNELHKKFLEAKIDTGTKVSLAAGFYRRQHKDPKQQWAMSVRFLPRTINVGKDEEETIVARNDIMAELEKDLAEKTLDVASMVLTNPAWNPPNKWGKDRVSRMRDWLHVAHRVGYPNFLNLWYYSRRPAWYYVRWETTKSERKTMTAGTNGQLPFDGNTGGIPEPLLEWRQYPFRKLVKQCRGHTNMDDCANMVANELQHAEEEIYLSIQDMNKEVQRLAPAANTNPTQGMVGAASDATGAEANAFLKD